MCKFCAFDAEISEIEHLVTSKYTFCSLQKWGGGGGGEVEEGGEKRRGEKAEEGSPDHIFCVEINLS